MSDRGNDDQRHGRLYDDLRKKLLDLSRRNPMLNYKHRTGSRRQLRIVDTTLESSFTELTVKQRELPFAALPEPDDIPEDELNNTFKAALGHAKSTDLEYLTRLAALDGVARQDDASLANLERWLRDRVREQLELSPRPNRKEFNLVEHARKKGIDPNYELSTKPLADGRIVRQLQSMFFADELDSRLARIVADARLSEQETGLSTLFLAFGFLRWYESNDSDVPNFAPLLLLPAQVSKRLQGRRAIYSLKAAAESPEINLSLRELMLRNAPDVSRHLPDFDEETDGIESYFEKVRGAIDGLGRWKIERNLTLGHFAFGRLAMYEDLASENWQEAPISYPLVESLLRGSDLESSGDLFFASDYDLDDETIENSAPILVTPTTKRGVRVLRDYLRYVESRRLEVGSLTGRDFDSDFERDVRARLEIRGFVADPQVGVAGYRIDLGVRHPDHPTVYLAGIECDGATFHSSKSARDRDRLRESVLRGKGWTIFRVWSTDWFADADLQTDRLVTELQRLSTRPVQSQSNWTIVSETPSAEAQVVLAELREVATTPASSSSTPAMKFEPEILAQRLDGVRLSEAEVKNKLRAFRDTEIISDFPGLDPERCILRDIMINKIVESRLDEPKDFTHKIPLWLRERTDQKQMKYLEQICSIVELL